jgi:dTDP-4-amino-4,6-dideoxygalactose transaminase
MAVSGRVGVAVPFVDLRLQHESLKEELLDDVAALLDTAAFLNGPPVAAFERAFADAVGTRDAVGVSSGLDALRLGLLALGIGPGDEVIVPAQTFVATFEAVTQVGAVPRVVDVDETSWGLDPDAAADAVTARTRALLPVHLYGQLADVRALLRLARRHDLHFVEDACQAHGAERDGLRAGAVGAAAAFSFYPSKNLGAIGDAGALTTSDAGVAAAVRALREHGQPEKDRHDLEGYTARLDTLQAAALLRKLPLLVGWNEERRAAALYYLEALEDVGDLLLPPVAPTSRPAWHLFVVRTAEPERLAAYLRERRITTGRHYPELAPFQPAYASLGYRRGAFPVAEGLARECLSLPLFPGITDEQLDAVAAAVRDFFARG